MAAAAEAPDADRPAALACAAKPTETSASRRRAHQAPYTPGGTWKTLQHAYNSNCRGDHDDTTIVCWCVCSGCG